jgi:hypothetical protein
MLHSPPLQGEGWVGTVLIVEIRMEFCMDGQTHREIIDAKLQRQL